MLAFRSLAVSPQQMFFSTTASKHKEVWDNTKSTLGLSWMAGPHVLRQTGPSEDAYSRRRSLADIQLRGRWKQIKSVQRYSKPYSVIVHNSRLQPELISFGSTMASQPRLLLKAFGDGAWGAIARQALATVVADVHFAGNEPAT